MPSAHGKAARSSPWLLLLSAVVIWATGTVLGTARQTARFVEREHTGLQVAFDTAYAAIVQRLDQNEALLDGLVALLRASRDPAFRELHAYANEMQARYAHVHTIGYQPRVELAQRAGFEQAMGRQLGRPFRIRDFEFEGDRRWHESPPRPFYFPVTIMAPPLPEAQEVIGYDVYADTRFRNAVALSSRLGAAASTLPFDLVEGGRGYIFLRALTLSGQDDATAQPPQHLISLLIRADRLFAGLQLPEGARLSLTHRGDTPAAAALIGQLGPAADAAPPTGGWLPALPPLRLHHAFPSTSQPFELKLEGRPRWEAFAWDMWSLWVVPWTALVVGLTIGAAVLRRSQRLRRQAQHRTELAERALATTELRAETSRARSLDQLGSGIAHELNQPLTAVVSYCQAALRIVQAPSGLSADSHAMLQATLRSAAEQALRAGELIQRMRTLVRQQPVKMAQVLLQDLIASSCRLERAHLEAAEVELVTQLPQAPVVVQADTLLLEQVLGNLLRNAVEALAATPPEQRRIVLELTTDAGHALLRVRDNGPGIAPERRAKVFHPFQSSKPGGIGIGLVVCSAIVEAHGGTLALEDADPSSSHPAGAGACFVIRLPLPSPP